MLVFAGEISALVSLNFFELQPSDDFFALIVIILLDVIYPSVLALFFCGEATTKLRRLFIYTFAPGVYLINSVRSSLA